MVQGAVFLEGSLGACESATIRGIKVLAETNGQRYWVYLNSISGFQPMDFKTARKHMVDSQVRTNDVTDLALQLAMEEVPREIFLPSNIKDQSYVEREHLYGDEDTARVMLKPRDFAKLVACAAPKAGELVLDVGCGSGYSTAILARLSEMVVAVEPDEALRAAAQENLVNLNTDNAAVVDASLEEGVPDQGPFDLIFIGAGIASEPEKLLEQLHDGGRLVAIWKEGHSAKGIIITRDGDAFTRLIAFDAGSGSVLTAFKPKKEFIF